MPYGLGAFYGGTGLGEGGFAGAGLLSPQGALAELLRAHLLAGAVLLPLASLALLYGTVFLSTTASALAAVAPLLLMRLLARAALAREESRGAHFREDFPLEDRPRHSLFQGWRLGFLPVGVE